MNRGYLLLIASAAILVGSAALLRYAPVDSKDRNVVGEETSGETLPRGGRVHSLAKDDTASRKPGMRQAVPAAGLQRKVANAPGAGEITSAPSQEVSDMQRALLGVVLSPSGLPVANASVAKAEGDYLNAAARIDTTDENGRFRIPLTAGEIPRYVAYAANYAVSHSVTIDREMVTAAANASDQPVIQLKLRPPHFLAGTVRNRHGEPVANVAVHAACWDSGDDSVGETTTAANGRYRLDGLSDGTHYIGLRHPDYGEESGGAVDTDQLDADFIIGKPKGMLIGQVLDSSTGRPVSKFRVVDESGVSPAVEGNEQEPGMFEVELPTTPTGFLIYARNYATLETEEIRASPGDEVVHRTFGMGPGCKVVGQLVADETSMPLVGARVVIATDGCEDSNQAPVEGTRETKTDENGNFETGFSRQEQAMLIVEPREELLPVKRSVPFKQGHTYNVGELRAVRPAAVTIQVLDDLTGRGIPSAHIGFVQDIDGCNRNQNRTAVDGILVLDKVYPVSTQLFCHEAASNLAIDPKPGEAMTVTFKVGSASWTGLVYRQGKTIPAAVLMRLANRPETGFSDVNRVMLRSGSEGSDRFEFKNVPGGTWKVIVTFADEANGQMRVEQSIIIAPGQQLEQNIYLK